MNMIVLRGQNQTAENSSSPSTSVSAAPITHDRTLECRSVSATAAAAVPIVAAPRGGRTSFGALTDMNASAWSSGAGTSAKMLG
jgi:hypothetical protein